MALDPVPPRVVVIGGGLAGLSAAFSAYKGGALVTVIEKSSNLGGNSAKATSGINAVFSKYQRARSDLKDSYETFYDDIMKAGGYKNNPDLVGVLVGRSGQALDTLSEDFSLNFEDIQQLGGHSAKRSHRFPPRDGRPVPVGWTIMSAIKKKLTEENEHSGRIDIRLNTSVGDFSFDQVKDDEGNMHSIISALKLTKTAAEEEVMDVSQGGVIIATGGFGANSSWDSLIGRYRPDLVGYPTTNDGFSTGDLLELGLRLGISAVDLEYVQLHPTGFVDLNDPLKNQKFLCPEVMRGVGAILLNLKGERFTNELLPRNALSTAIINNGGSTLMEWGFSDRESKQRIVMMLMSDDVANNFGIEAFKFYISRGLIIEVTDFQTQFPNVPYSAVIQTIRDLNRYAAGEDIDPFGKTVHPRPLMIEDKTFYVAFVTPSIHFSMGGLKVDATARVYRDNEPIINLFAAGEVAGGIHGANRLGGNGCLESIVYGQLSGKLATTLSLRPSIHNHEILWGDKLEVARVQFQEGAPQRVTLLLPIISALPALKIGQVKSAILNSKVNLSLKITSTSTPGLVEAIVEYKPRIWPGDSFEFF